METIYLAMGHQSLDCGLNGIPTCNTVHLTPYEMIPPRTPAGPHTAIVRQHMHAYLLSCTVDAFIVSTVHVGSLLYGEVQIGGALQAHTTPRFSHQPSSDMTHGESQQSETILLRMLQDKFHRLAVHTMSRVC